MKQSTLHGRVTISFRKLAVILVAFTITWILQSHRTATPPEKIKSRFPSMKFDKTIAENLRKLPKYDHFIFQLTGSDRNGGLGKRRVYTLVVYAVDTAGNPLDPNSSTPEIDPTILKYTDEKTDKKISDRNVEIRLANYIMSDRQYQALAGHETTNFLQFDPSLKDPDNKYIFKGYISYQVYPVATSSAGINSKGIVTKDFLEGDGYLKPSPPAPPVSPTRYLPPLEILQFYNKQFKPPYPIL
jgi:hypothetical protein